MAVVCEQMIKSQAEQLAGKPYSELKSPRRGSRDGRKDVSPRTRPAEEGSLIDLQESPAAPSASQSQVPRAFSLPASHSQLSIPLHNCLYIRYIIHN